MALLAHRSSSIDHLLKDKSSPEELNLFKVMHIEHHLECNLASTSNENPHEEQNSDS